MAELSGTAFEHFETLRRESGDFLKAQGSVCAGSGSLSWNAGKLAIHTDFGPADQDKDTNQDFALAWVGDESRDDISVRWAVALADGVTSSWFAENGAKIACWAALAAVVSPDGDPSGRQRKAISAAGDAVGQIGDFIQRDPEAYLPTGEFPSTWKFILREGQLLQTTLCLAWQEGEMITLAFIGDGGAAIQRGAGDDQRIDIIGDLDEETNRVHALGPRNRQVREPDVFHQFVVDGSTRLALFTDGVGRGLHPNHESLFDEADEFENEEANVAERLIARWISRRGTGFEDNLSLVILTEAGRIIRDESGATVPC